MPVDQKEKKLIFPPWLKQKVNTEKLTKMQNFLRERKIETVCENALCPNRGECYRRGVATFMILGAVCTRNCKFCAVKNGKPENLDTEEPKKIAKATKELKLKYVVITSVTRDDLSDGGACQFAKVIQEVKKINFQTITEVLVPDFHGDYLAIKKVVEAGPQVFSHNLETIPRLYPEIRPKANYQKSLKVLEIVKRINNNILTKSGLMLGLGESSREVEMVMDDLRKINCNILTLGQYLAPTIKHYPIKAFISPEIFKEYKKIALKKGFSYVASGPWIRSSYWADKINIKT